MTGRFKDFLTSNQALIDRELPLFIDKLYAPKALKEAMHYSVKAGGKRLRPVLLLAVLDAFNEPIKKGIPTACALEMIHTYSLIHDDLPAMDDDDLRRGQPTNHTVFGEATAILAGDALLTYAFQIIAEDHQVNPATKIQLMTSLAKAAGASGMVGGQVDDLQAENKNISLKELESIHHRKTGQLLMFAVESGAVLAGVDDKQLYALGQFAEHIGLAFQIRDDILDVEGDEGLTGKRIGSDESNDKSTYPKLLTIDGAKNKLNTHLETAKKHLISAGINHELLMELAEYVRFRTV